MNGVNAAVCATSSGTVADPISDVIEIRGVGERQVVTTIQRWWRARAVPVPVLPCSKTRGKKMKNSRKKVSSCKAGARKSSRKGVV